jgi:PAP2 superfamily
MSFPHLVYDSKSRWTHLFIGAFCTLFLYQFTNRVHLFEPRILPFTRVDANMPLWSWTVWIYFTEYLFFLYAYFGVRDYELVSRYYMAYMSILLFSIGVFVLFPVSFPRSSFPVTGASLSDNALLFLRTYMDQPANCLPSLHVSSCFISSFCFWKESKTRAVLLSLWSCLVAISTMTTKQHYFVDVWSAMILTIVAYWFFFHYLELDGQLDLLPKMNGNGAKAPDSPLVD